jgi:sec-independent protein translocase protein TatA
MIQSTLLFLSGPDLAIIVVLALFLFGGKKIPELARGLGKGIKEFKDAQDGVNPSANNPEKKA